MPDFVGYPAGGVGGEVEDGGGWAGEDAVAARNSATVAAENEQSVQRLRIDPGDDPGMGRRSQGLGDQIGVDTDLSSANSRGVARSRCVI